MAAAGREEGAYLNRYVTDPAAAGQPPALFRRTPPGVASWLFFCVAHSSCINSDMLVVRALKDSQLIRPLADESYVIYVDVNTFDFIPR
jgi:hypothetical protein